MDPKKESTLWYQLESPLLPFSKLKKKKRRGLVPGVIGFLGYPGVFGNNISRTIKFLKEQQIYFWP
jgi:hypothetical protein